MENKEFVGEMEWFCEYYEYKMNGRMMKVWYQLAAVYTVEYFRKALRDHIRFDEQPFFPAFGKIHQQLIKTKRLAQ